VELRACVFIEYIHTSVCIVCLPDCFAYRLPCAPAVPLALRDGQLAGAPGVEDDVIEPFPASGRVGVDEWEWTSGSPARFWSQPQLFF
jgi:hypothetical protein